MLLWDWHTPAWKWCMPLSECLACIEISAYLRLVFYPVGLVFMGPVNMEFSKFCFKTGSHDTIHTFKNYFATIFSAISFQFSIISGIQIDSF